jgi:hypothetical protein
MIIEKERKVEHRQCTLPLPTGYDEFDTPGVVFDNIEEYKIEELQNLTDFEKAQFRKAIDERMSYNLQRAQTGFIDAFFKKLDLIRSGCSSMDNTFLAQYSKVVRFLEDGKRKNLSLLQTLNHKIQDGIMNSRFEERKREDNIEKVKLLNERGFLIDEIKNITGIERKEINEYLVIISDRKKEESEDLERAGFDNKI